MHDQQEHDDPGLITRAAEGDRLAGDEQVDLLAYFVDNGSLPGDDDRYPLEFETGDERGRTIRNTWWVRRLEWDEWQDNLERATDSDGKRDNYVACAWNVARTLVEPQLGPRVLAMREQDPDGAPEHAAELLQRMFARQASVLVDMSAAVLSLSRLSGTERSARILDHQEVAAGKR
jgi:hypothetical protein